VADSFVAVDADFARALVYAVDWGVDQVSEALGDVNATPAGQAAVNYAWRRGVPVIASAADEQSLHHNYPANYEHTLWVNSVRPADGEILVTGASGGVGSIAVALLAKRGYTVVASTGRMQEVEYLRSLGASSVMDRAELSAPGKPLGRERWAGVVDSVGSHTLANACATTKYRGAVTACGLAQGMDFPASVAPFILRGVALYGIESVRAPLALRSTAWERLAADLDLAKLETITHEIGLADAIAAADDLLAGHVRGRLVVNVNR